MKKVIFENPGTAVVKFEDCNILGGKFYGCDIEGKRSVLSFDSTSYHLLDPFTVKKSDYFYRRDTALYLIELKANYPSIAIFEFDTPADMYKWILKI